ncbi:MAG: two-component system response regulator [Betaproteobacteria bacterium]
MTPAPLPEGTETEPAPIRVLLLEDNPDDAFLIRRAFGSPRLRGFELMDTAQRVSTAVAALAKNRGRAFDIVLTDLDLPDSVGVETVTALHRTAPDMPIVVLTGQPDEALGVAALRRGAQDYLIKGQVEPTLLARTLRHAIERKRLLVELDRARGELEERVRERTAALVQANQSLRETEERYRKLIEMSPDAIRVQKGGRIVMANPAALALYGARSEIEILGRSPLDFIDPAFHGMAHERTALLDRPGTTMAPLEQVHRRLDGTRLQVEVRGASVELGGEVHALIVVRDIGERKAQEERIARLHRIQVMLSAINSAIVRIRDRGELFQEACRIAVEHGGLPMAWIAARDGAGSDFRPVAGAGFDVTGLGSVPMRLEADAPEARGVAGRAIREKRTVVDNDILANPGVGYYRTHAIQRGFRSSIALPLAVEDQVVGVFIMYAEGSGFFTTEEVKLLEELATDVSFALDYLEKAARADYLAYYDPLTGLPNRTLFHVHLGQHLRTRGAEQAMVAVLLFNIDRFRSVNETLGREAGDKLLKKVAARLKAAMEGSEMPARVSAGAFALILRGASHAGDLARAVEGIIRACFDPAYEINEHELRVSVRVGIALYPSDGRDAERLFRNAEAALAKAKAGGERVEFYAPEFNARVAEALVLETRLRRAIDRGEFILHYQPKLSLESGRITGVEALMRWQDPVDGLVPPGKFIRVLEDTGLILEAGRQVLARALAERRTWEGTGLAVPRVAVNVSSIQLQRRDFVREVLDAIEAAGSGGSALELEITESQVMRELDTNIAKLRELRALDIEVAVDDFGTGYSSLNYVAKLPVTALKIDRSFIVGMTEGPGGLAIVSTIVGLSHSLGFRSVAEGVETEEQAGLLRSLRCNEMQGYLFSRPLPPAEFEALLRKTNGQEPGLARPAPTSPPTP